MAQRWEPDLLIVGGSTGGVAAALAALRLGRRVLLTHETPWIGGQLTAQAVPPDEHPWIEVRGSTATYRQFRAGVREYYRRHYPLLPHVREDPFFNPGGGWVSRLCFEPRVGLAVLEAMLAPYRANRQLWLQEGIPTRAWTERDTLKAVEVSEEEGSSIVSAPYVLDATETGELLELARVEHVVGAESQVMTGELHAPAQADPRDQQAFTWVVAVDLLGTEPIAEPPNYRFWRDFTPPSWPGPLLSWTYPDPIEGTPRTRPFLGDQGLWTYRRIFARDRYPAGRYASDVSLLNWPQNDYMLGPLLGVSPEERAHHLQQAQELSLSLLYWLQTEAPRDDGGYGYPLRPRGDLLGSANGLALAPYLRESRRIQAIFTVREEHLGVAARHPLEGAERFFDAMGIGAYRIDLHPSSRRGYLDLATWPFQIPLGALIPVRLRNLLPASKNLGVTHITNGCFRLHPVEWTVGEAAGALASFCLERRPEPIHVRSDPNLLEEFQRLLVQLGFELAWPEAERLRKL